MWCATFADLKSRSPRPASQLSYRAGACCSIVQVALFGPRDPARLIADIRYIVQLSFSTPRTPMEMQRTRIHG